MATEPILLVAAGGLARETMAAVRAAVSLHVVGLLDDDPRLHGGAVGGVGVLGGTEMVARHRDVRLLVCAGNGRTREAIVRRLAGFGVDRERYVTVLHPSVAASEECQIGPGSILLAHVSLTCDVVLGSHVVVMPGVTLTHDDVVGDFGTLCGGVSLGGDVNVGHAAYLGMNATVRQRVRIGAYATVGMGAVVLTDVADGGTVVGNPARPLSRRARSRPSAPVPGRLHPGRTDR